MKRFTATEKWDKEWFQELDPAIKCLWLYICDHSDSAGVWEPNWKLASFAIGKKVTAEDLKYFGERIVLLAGGKLWVAGFIAFQYGRLSKECRPHVKIFESISKHDLVYTEDYECLMRTRVGRVSEGKRKFIYERDGHACVYCGGKDSLEPDHIVPRNKGGSDEIRNLVTACHACNTLKNDKELSEFLILNPDKERVSEYVYRVLNTLPDRDKEQDKEKEAVPEQEGPKPIRLDKSKGIESDIVAFVIELGLPGSDGTACFHKWEGNGWKNGTAPIKCWRSTIRSWKENHYMPSQKGRNGNPSHSIVENIQPPIFSP